MNRLGLHTHKRRRETQEVYTVTLKKEKRWIRKRRGAGTFLFRCEEEKHINHPETSVHMLLYNSVKALLTRCLVPCKDKKVAEISYRQQQCFEKSIITL